jgi:hypothetical protein
MPRVVPSQVVAFIEKVVPYLTKQTENQQINLTRDSAGELAGLLDLVSAIPDELLILEGNDFAELVCSVAANQRANRIVARTPRAR